MAPRSLRVQLGGVLAFVGVIWCVFLLGLILPFHLESFGITPRSLRGLPGILAAPFLHANLAHLVSNTVPLTVLLLLLAGSRSEPWGVVTAIIVLGGGLLWLFGRPAIHIGASGLIYGLIAYLIVAGVSERRIVPMISALVVGLCYGGTLISGVLPRTPHISWEGHLFGALAGGAVAYSLARVRADDRPATP